MGAYQGVACSPHPKAAHDKFHTFAKSVRILPLSLAVAERWVESYKGTKAAMK
jgi:hypothetical protein